MSSKKTEWRRLASIPSKINTHGLSWLIKRIGVEFRLPTTKFGLIMLDFNKLLFRVLLFPFKVILRILLWAKCDASTIYAFIDLDVCPVTYDVVDFLLLATLEQKEKNLDSVHVIVVPGHDKGFKEEEPGYASIYDHDSRRWRLNNLCVPILNLAPNISGYTICSSRNQASLLLILAKHVSPEGYSVLFPKIPKRSELMDRAHAGEALLPFLQSPPQAVKYIENWLSHIAEDRRVICITLRESRYGPERNSNVDAWVKFARQLDPMLYQPIFILDTDTAMAFDSAYFSGLTVFREGAWNVCLRSALYEKSWLSMGVVCGPTELCWYNQNCRYMFFISLDNLSEERVGLMKESGFDIGHQFIFAEPLQQIIWEEDNLDIITTSFEEIRQEIEAIKSIKIQ